MFIEFQFNHIKVIMPKDPFYLYLEHRTQDNRKLSGSL
jgi:hypothetical protein